MDLMTIFTILSNIVVASMGWLLKTFYNRLEELRADLQDTREKYVHKDDIRELKQEMGQRFDRVERLLLDQLRGDK